MRELSSCIYSNRARRHALGDIPGRICYKAYRRALVCRVVLGCMVIMLCVVQCRLRGGPQSVTDVCCMAGEFF
jgi:hypothetical protein